MAFVNPTYNPVIDELTDATACSTSNFDQEILKAEKVFEEFLKRESVKTIDITSIDPKRRLPRSLRSTHQERSGCDESAIKIGSLEGKSYFSCLLSKFNHFQYGDGDGDGDG